jgi:hypothetical protein
MDGASLRFSVVLGDGPCAGLGAESPPHSVCSDGNHRIHLVSLSLGFTRCPLAGLAQSPERRVRLRPDVRMSVEQRGPDCLDSVGAIQARQTRIAPRLTHRSGSQVAVSCSLIAASRGTSARVCVTNVLKSPRSTTFTPACSPIARSTSPSGVSRAVRLTRDNGVRAISEIWPAGCATDRRLPHR